jgi:type IV secretory pathway component VirB8
MTFSLPGLFRKGTATKAPADIEAKIGDFLSKHDSAANPQVRQRMESKVLIIMCGILGALNIIQAVAITQLLPLYKVVPVFVTFSDRADQVVRIEPPSGRIPSINLLVEQNVRDYITFRNSVSADANETVERWGSRVRIMSTEDVYQAFLRETNPVYTELRNNNFTRTITIRAVLQTQPGFYQVEFDTYDRRQGTGLTDTNETRTTWVAQMRVTLMPRNVAFEQRMLNPLGFTVVNYSVARKRT